MHSSGHIYDGKSTNNYVVK